MNLQEESLQHQVSERLNSVLMIDLTMLCDLIIDVQLIKNNAALGAKISVSLSQLSQDRKSSGKALEAARDVTVIGGAAIDIISKSESIQPGSSNSHVGKIIMHEGGSTRNTAECLGRLGLGNRTTFISGVGDDDKRSLICNSLTSVGLSADALCLKAG